MFNTTAKMSLEASDVQTDEDYEELDGFSFSADFLEKKTKRKRSSGKPPLSPKSPYLSSMNMNSRRAAVAAWRLPRASLGDTRGDTPGERGSAHLTSLSNGYDASQTLRSECDVTPELLKQTLSMRKHKQLHSGSNGFTLSPGDCRDKEDMYDEIIRLKKSLHAQKSDNQQMKAKVRRLEEDNAKREKQIEELLDPTKGSEYTRSLVDKKRDGSVVLNGLKQRILKLEQQCREKENALSKLQSDLRTTNLEELKITIETYYEEIQRLRMLLEAAEKSSRAESKCSQRQQKALSSTVHRLSENLKQLQQENTALREELNTDSPAGGLKGYREWSKQRLLRRLLEVEKRREDSRRPTQSAKSSGRLDQEVQVTPTEILGFTMATEAVVSVGTITEEGEEGSDLRERLSQLEKERAELQETLSSKDDELRQLRTEREELEKETERWKDEQTKERDKERQQHKQELDQLLARIQTLEEDRGKPAQAELSSVCGTSPEDNKDTEAGAGVKEGEERDTGGGGEKEGRGDEELTTDAEKKAEKEREKAALAIQKHWREHRNRDIVMLQSALRGHLIRGSQLQDLLKDTQNKAVEATNHGNDASSKEGELDVVALMMIQSAFRGHLGRCSLFVFLYHHGLLLLLSVPPELPQQHDCKVEEVLADQQFCSQKRTSSLDQEEPEPPQIKEEQEEPEPRQVKEEQEESEPPQVKEEQEELCISQEGEQLVVKQETDIFMMTPTDEESDHNEPELKSDHQLLSHSCHIAEGQDQKGVEHGDSGSTRNAVPEPESQHYIIRSYNVYNSTMSKIHCNIHTGVKPFKCNTCGKAFKYKSQFYTHVRIHTGEKPYFCKTCGKRFSDSSTLKSHLTIHTDEKPHTCKTCGKGFRRSCGLKRHLRTHTGERPYVCNTCEKRFCEMSQLKTHMITHTGEKPYPCNICGKRFSRTPDLKRHTRIHTGERAFTSKTWKDFQT